ncbi:DUF881 domain-containing protein [Patescibacteria group bacterium]|nr:DUF881 domain-containing protein [Patescibacteria group bacterium]
MVELKKRTIILFYVLVGLVLGVFLGLGTKDGGDAIILTNEEKDTRDELLKEFLDEQAYLQSRVVGLREQIDEAQKELESTSALFNLGRLEKLKGSIGLSEVRGPGLEILLNDSPFTKREGEMIVSEDLVQASDLRDIINLLNAGGAKAISVNNQRIVATTPISAVANAVLVNNSYVTPPFTIQAVGDTESMLRRLLNDSILDNLYERRKSFNIVFEIAARSMVTIPIFNGNLDTNYLNLVQ